MTRNIHVNAYIHDRFVEAHDLGDLMQTSAWGTVKELMGWRSRRVAIGENGKVVGTAQILLYAIRATPYTIAYIPRGFVTDYTNLEYVKALWEEVKRIAREEQAIFVKMDPDVNRGTGIVFERLLEIGFRHKGFEKGFPYTQPRHRMELNLEGELDDIFSSFQRRTRSKIRTSLKNGLRFEKGEASDLPVFSELMKETGQRDGFVTRELSYFQKLYQTLHTANQAELFFCRLYPVEVLQELENEKKQLSEKQQQVLMKNPQSEAKSLKQSNQLEEINRRLHKIEKSMIEMNVLKQTHPEGKILSGALYTAAAGKAHYLYGASSNDYRTYLPNYRMQWEMICHAKATGMTTYDFGGVSGYATEEDPYQGLYDFKKLFGTEMKEKIGEFDYILQPALYQAYEKGVPLLKKVKRLALQES